MIDSSESRTGRQVMLECFNLRRRPFRQRFNAAVGKIFDVANNLMPRRSPLRKETIANALHIAADKKATRDTVRMRGEI